MIPKEYLDLFNTVAEFGINKHVKHNLKRALILAYKDPGLGCPILTMYLYKNPKSILIKFVYILLCEHKERPTKPEEIYQLFLEVKKEIGLLNKP